MEKKITKRILALLTGKDWEYCLGFALMHGAHLGELRDKADFAVWLTKQPKETKNEFLDIFADDDECGLRVCDTCGKFMTEGYYLAGEYACDRECAVKNYMSSSYNHSENGVVSREQAESYLDLDLKLDEEQCLGNVYYTEWEP